MNALEDTRGLANPCSIAIFDDSSRTFNYVVALRHLILRQIQPSFGRVHLINTLALQIPNTCTLETSPAL